MEYDDYDSTSASGGYDEQPKPSKSRRRARNEQPSPTEYSGYDETYQPVRSQSRGPAGKFLIGGAAAGLVMLLIWLLAGKEKQALPGHAMSEQYRFDDEGRLIAAVSPAGDRTEVTYNDAGLPVEVKHPGGKTQYGYDENGNRIWMRDGTGSTEYYYDAFDRLIGVISRHSPWRWIDYEYDPWNRLRAIRIFDLQQMEQDRKYRELLAELDRDLGVRASQWRNNARKFNELRQRAQQESEAALQQWLDYDVRYRHDLSGNLIEVKTKWGDIRYSHDPEKGLIERYLPNGIKTSITTSSDGLLQSVHHQDRAGQLIAEYRYDYNVAGKVTRVDEKIPEGSKAIDYVWDTRGYLKELRLPDGNKIRYSYDAMGNRILQEDANGAQRYEYDQLGRLTFDGKFKYEWDRNGNFISRTDGQIRERIKYSGALPAQIKTPHDDVRYNWDGDRNLISRIAGKEITHYLQNPLLPRGFTLAEFDRHNKLTASYLYGDVLLGQQNENGQMQFFLEDGFNSIRQVSDMSGNIAGRWNFTPFAEPFDLSGEARLNFRTAGERFLREMPIYFTDERMFNPKLGWYLMPDPFAGYIHRFDSFNKYAHGCKARGSFAEPRCNQTRKREMENFLNYINMTEPKKFYFPQTVILGLGEGKDKIESILKEWGDNFPLIVLTSTGNGALDLLKYASRTGPGEIPEYLRDIRSDYVYLHSGGGTVLFRGDVATYYYDPAFQRTDTYGIGKVSDLTAWHFERAGDAPVIAWEFKDIPRFMRGVINVAIDGSQLQPWKGHGLDEQFNIFGSKPSNPTNKVWIYDEHSGKWWYYERDTDGRWRRKSKPEGSDDIPNRDEIEKYFKPPNGPGGGGGRGGSDGPGGPSDGSGGPGDSGGPESFGGTPGKGGPFNDPFTAVERELGGIKLAATAQFMGNLGSITGAVYDLEKQCLVLLSDQNISLPPMQPEDLAVALISVFGSMPQDLQFSLDPDDPQNPRGKWQKAVYIPEEILAGTSFGQAMFEADWLLKQYSFGVRVDSSGKALERKSSVPGFKSTADLAFAASGNAYGKESWARLWIVADDADADEEHNMTLKLASDGHSIYYDVAKMAVRAKKQVPDPSSPTGLRDVDTADDLTASQFVGIFTELYDEISKESLEFGRVKELAKAVALAKWLKQQGIPVDMAWIAKYAGKRIKTVERVTALSVTKKRTYETTYASYDNTLHLFGGVDGGVEPKFVQDDGTADRLQKAVMAKLRERDAGPIFSIQHDGKMLRAWVLPATNSGQDMWKNLPPLNFVYQLNNQGRISKVITGGGRGAGIDNGDDNESGVHSHGHVHAEEDTTEYNYETDGKLKTVKISNHNGWQMLGERNDNGSLWTSKSPGGNTFKYKYGGAGYLSEIEVDGRRWATYEIDPKQLQAKIRYNDYTETFDYNPAGQITTYERVTENGSTETERLFLDYDKSGNLIRIGGTNAPAIRVSYGNDGVSPATVATPQAKMRFEYDADKRIKTITHSSGVSANYAYDGQLLKRLQLAHQGRQAEYWFDENGVVKSRDFLGGVAEYGYTNGRLTSVTQNQDSARYIYDERNRLRDMHFPDGSWIEYRYDEKISWPQKAATSKRKILTIISHPALPKL